VGEIWHTAVAPKSKSAGHLDLDRKRSPMPRRYKDYDPQRLLRAARLARLPGIRRALACERFGLSIGVLRRAIREAGAAACPPPRDIVLHAFTHGGTRLSGEMRDLGSVASYVDFVNKDGMTAEGVETILEALVREGTLAIEGDQWRLLVEFP
jgi:hypothetical protein